MCFHENKCRSVESRESFDVDTSSYCVLCVYLFTKIDIVCAIAKSKRHVAGCHLRCRLEVKIECLQDLNA